MTVVAADLNLLRKQTNHKIGFWNEASFRFQFHIHRWSICATASALFLSALPLCRVPCGRLMNLWKITWMREIFVIFFFVFEKCLKSILTFGDWTSFHGMWMEITGNQSHKSHMKFISVRLFFYSKTVTSDIEFPMLMKYFVSFIVVVRAVENSVNSCCSKVLCWYFVCNLFILSPAAKIRVSLRHMCCCSHT